MPALQHVLKSLVIPAVSLSFSGAAFAATETYTFDATLTSGTLLCGDFVGGEVPCPALFGVIDEATNLDDLMVGLSIGQTYPGRIDLIYDETSSGLSLADATCVLNGTNCKFSGDFLPLGSTSLGAAPGVLDFSNTSVVESLFNITGSTGTYAFGTDYLFRSDGSVYYYFDVDFDLSNVDYTVVPLPASLPFLLVSLGGLALIRRKKARA